MNWFSFLLLELFLGFLKAYVEKFSYKSITTDDWKDFLYSYFKDKVRFKNLFYFSFSIYLYLLTDYVNLNYLIVVLVQNLF